MRAKEEPSWFDGQLPPELRDVVAKAFESMDDPNFTGKVYRETFTIQGNPPQISQGIPSQIFQGNSSLGTPGPLVRWEYYPDEWQLFDRIDWGRALRRFILTVTVPLLLYIAIVILIILAASSLPGQEALITVIIVSVPLLAVLIIPFLYGWLKFREARKRHLARQIGPCRVTIGNLHLNDQDMWIAGVHISLQELFIKLVKVQPSLRPPFVIKLRRRHSLRTGNGRWRDSIHLLVPRGHEVEAKLLVEYLRNQTIGASRRSYVPVEPE